MYRFIAHLALILVFGFIARIAGAATTLGREEGVFLQDLYAQGQGEIALAQIVKERTNTPTIQEYTARLIRDHTELAGEITAIADKRGIALPRNPPPESTAAQRELEDKVGKDLERAYMRRALQEHRAMMVRLEEQGRNARDAEVRALARTSLARAREHLALAQRWDPTLSPAPPPLVRTIPGGDR